MPPSKHRRIQALPLSYYQDGIAAGDSVVLGRAITLIESELTEQRELAEQILQFCLPKSGNSIRVGITGSPGVGKSTLIEALGTHLVETEKKVAVLAVDPSSQRTGGSIMGDKTRMQELSRTKGAFVRPSPAGNSLGGVAARTREGIILCEAAGYEVILVETVGVGQSETLVHALVDLMLLVLLPNAGDELQGIKRGIVEMADLLVVNKADGEQIKSAKNTVKSYRSALQLFPKTGDWQSKVLLASALEKSGILPLWDAILAFQKTAQQTNTWTTRRQHQRTQWLEEQIQMELRQSFDQHPEVKALLPDLMEQVRRAECSPTYAAKLLLAAFRRV